MSDHGDESHLSCDSQVLHGIGPIDWQAEVSGVRAPAVPVAVHRVADDDRGNEGNPGDAPGFGPVVIPLDLLGHMVVAPMFAAALEEELAAGAGATVAVVDLPLPPSPPPPPPPVVGGGASSDVPRGEAESAGMPRSGTPVASGSKKAADSRDGAVEVGRLEREVGALRQTAAGLQRQVQDAVSAVAGLRALVEDVREENRSLRSRLKKIERDVPRELEGLEKRERKRTEQETVGADLTDRRLQLIEYHLKRINEVLQLGPLDHPDAVTVRDLVRHLSRVYSELKTGKAKVPAATGVTR